jgi:WD40 repeat protein/serine/threonine protein kinase
MSLSSSSGPDPLNPLAEEFVARYRRGERPALSEYTAQHPELAEQIRALFPALVLMEQEGSVASPATGPDLRRDTDGSPVPRQLGEYRLLREIGRGGMGVVYEAVQESLGRHVALKVLPGYGLASPTHRERFRREAQAAARLHHTNIVPVFGVGEHQGTHYYVMQFIQGQGLDVVLDEVKRLREGPDRPAAYPEVAASVAQGLLTGRFARVVPDQANAGGLEPPRAPVSPLSAAGSDPVSAVGSDHPATLAGQSEPKYFRSVARVGVQVADALTYAHGQGILHRDIKPSNLLLDTQGTVWVTDFGLAKTDESEALTSPGDLVGTLRYMAPERLQGQSEARGDVYSLGLTLYELLTLRPAFAETNRARLIEKVTHEEPPRPRQLDRQIPRDLETIVLKAMAKDPGQRYATATALAEDLRRFLADRPIQARRAAHWERLWRWCRRNPAVASLLAVVAVLAVAFVGYQAWALHRLAAEQRQTQAARDAAQLQAAELALDKGQLLGEQGDVNPALLWMARSLKLAPAEAGALRSVARANLGAWSGRVHPLRLILPHETPVDTVAFTADGKALLTAGGRNDKAAVVRRWDPVNGRPVGDPLVSAGRGVNVERITFSPDDSRVLIPYSDGVTRLLNLADGKTLWQSPPQAGMITTTAFSPDGQRLLVAWSDAPLQSQCRTGIVQLWETATGKPLTRLLPHDRPVWAAAFHPDGKTFVTECGIWNDPSDRGLARFWDVGGHEIRKPLEQPSHGVAVAFSPDGQKLLTGHWDFTAGLWDLASGQCLRTLQHEGPLRTVAFGPDGDGKTLLTASFDGIARLWDAATGQPLGPPLRHQSLVYGAAFSPDGRTLATGAWDHTVRLWEVAAHSPAERPAAAFFPLGMSPDRRTVLARNADQTVQLRDAVSGQPKGTVLRPKGRVLAGALSPDGQSAVTTGEDGSSWLWDLASGQALTQLPHPDPGWALAFSPDSKTLVTGEWNEARLWDAARGTPLRQPLHRHAEGPVFAVAFSPDGRMVLTGGADGTARFWDAATSRPNGTPLVHYPAVLAVAFRPDGKAVLTGGADSTARVWDVATGKPLGPPLPHQGTVYAVAFSRDGRTVLTGSRDRTVRLWDAATGKLLGPPLQHPGPVLGVTFGPDDQTVLAAVGKKHGQVDPADTTQCWRVPAPVSGDADQVALWIQVLTGMELEANGAVRLLDAATWQQRRQQLQDAGLQGP